MTGWPLLEVVVAVGAWVETVDVILDTGYDGGLIVPTRVGSEIEARGIRGRLVMPDGGVHVVDTWSGEIDIHRRVFPVRVRCFGTEFILGREVLDQMEVCFVFGREVRVRLDE
jgi:predicted aspartyl protease